MNKEKFYNLFLNGFLCRFGFHSWDNWKIKEVNVQLYQYGIAGEPHFILIQERYCKICNFRTKKNL